MPGNFNSDALTDVLFYDAKAGEINVHTFTADGNFWLLKKHLGMRTSWSHFVPASFNGDAFTDVYFYDATVGEVNLHTFTSDGNFWLFKKHLGWRQTWKSFLSL